MAEQQYNGRYGGTTTQPLNNDNLQRQKYYQDLEKKSAASSMGIPNDWLLTPEQADQQKEDANYRRETSGWFGNAGTGPRTYSQAYGEPSKQQKAAGYAGGTGASTVYTRLPQYSDALRLINNMESKKVAEQQKIMQDAQNSLANIKAGNFTYSDPIAKTLQNPKAIYENYNSMVKSDENGRPLTGAGNTFLAPLGSAKTMAPARPNESQWNPANSARIYGLSTGKDLGAINPETAYEQQARDLTAQRAGQARDIGQNVNQSFSTGMTSPNKFLSSILNSITPSTKGV